MADQEQRLVALEERVARLEKVSDLNAQVFSDSLQFAELCIQALQRGFDDMVGGTVKLLEVEPARAQSYDVIDTDGELTKATVHLPARVAVDFKAYLHDALQQRLANEKAAEAPDAGAQIAFEFGG